MRPSLPGGRVTALLLAPSLLLLLPRALRAQSEQPVQLDPFEVSTDRDNSYGALNSNSLTRFNIELSKAPISADIFDQAFMDDVQPSSLESLLTTYSAGAGFNGSDSGGSAASNQPGDRNGNYYLSIRGLASPVTQRDSFMPVGAFGNPGSTGVDFTSLFDTERAELIRGPQALLYAGGGAGGVINTVSKQARFDTDQGRVSYQVDQYGSKQAMLDYSLGGDNVAVRTAIIEQAIDNRRTNIGGTIDGEYAQVAVRAFRTTTFRLTAEETNFSRDWNSVSTVTLPTSDPRTGDELTYLLATNQAGPASPAGGVPYAGGAIDNGYLNWSNVNSYAGWQTSELVNNTWSTLVADSTWNSWLSSEVAVGYDDYHSDKVGGNATLLAPGASGNTLTGWTASLTPSDLSQPARTKSFRAFVLATNDLFGGHAHSQTILGGDFLRTDMAQIQYGYFQADSNFNVIVNPAVTTNNGRTAMPAQLWPINAGPVFYNLSMPRATQVVGTNGLNYVRMVSNPPDATRVSALDPLGVNLGGSSYVLAKLFNKGIFGMNSTSWMDGKLTTMAGFRASASIEDRLDQGQNAPPLPTETEKDSRASFVNFSLGANYALTNWLRAYVEASSSYDPPPVEAPDPLGGVPKTAHAIGEETGLKFSNADNTLSGSLAFYHVLSRNEEFEISSTLENDIDPNGLNGKAGAAGVWINLDRESQGIELTLTANPMPNLRLRFSGAVTDGQTLNTIVFPQTYNDQFNVNGSGQVTYADGTVVYVSSAATSKSTATQAVVSASSPGAVPLTLGLMSSPTSVYWANPASVTGLINSSSLVANVLRTVDPVHGSILTGATGLPISDLQINPLSNPANIGPPGSIVVAQAGDASLGYDQFAFNSTGVYTFASGLAKGLRLGGSVILGWKYRDYYYYPTGIGPTAVRTLFFLPDQAIFNGILGYSRKFRTVTWSTQLNVSNVFNHYHIVILPGPNTGYTANGTGMNATFDQQPRMYVWTNTISF